MDREWSYEPNTDEYSPLYRYGFASRSKSGKVFYVNEQTAGVTREATDWDQLISGLNMDISNRERWILEDPEYADEYQADIDRNRQDIVRFQANAQSGSDIWSLSARACSYVQEPTDRKCVSEYNLPISLGVNSSEHGGYIYEAASKSWVSIWGQYSDL